MISCPIYRKQSLLSRATKTKNLYNRKMAQEPFMVKYDKSSLYHILNFKRKELTLKLIWEKTQFQE